MKTRVYIGYGIGVTALAAVLVGVTGNDVFAQEPEATINVRCNATHCLLNRETFVELVEAHNAQVAEINRLKASCGLKIERNT